MRPQTPVGTPDPNPGSWNAFARKRNLSFSRWEALTEATLLRRRGGAALSRCGPAGASEKLLLLEKDGS